MSTVRETVRGASVVSLGTAVGQIIAFAGSLLLVRIFTPEQMGLFTTIVAVASFVAPVASGRLAMAIPLPQADNSAMMLAKMATVGAAFFGLVGAGLILALTAMGVVEISLGMIWWWGLPSLVVSLAVYLGANQLAVRFQKYGGLALRGVLYPSVMVASQILLGIANFGASSLVIGMALGHVVTALTLWLPVQQSLRKEQAKDPVSNLKAPSWRGLIREYRSFPIFLGPAGMVNGLAMQLPQIGITLLFGLAVGGQFGMMMRILSVPVALIGQSIGFVYAGQIAKARRDGETNVRELFDRLSVRLSLVSLAFMFGVILVGEPLFAWLLGEPWRLSGELAALFVTSTAAQLVSSPLSQTLVVSGRTGLQLTIDLVRAGSLVITFAVLAIADIDVTLSVLAVSLVSAIGYLIMWLMNRRAAGAVQLDRSKMSTPAKSLH